MISPFMQKIKMLQAKEKRDAQDREKWNAKFGRLIEQMRAMQSYSTRLYTAVCDLESLWITTKFGRVCGNPKCFKNAGGPGHAPGVPFSFCGIRCSRIVRAQRFRDKRKAATKITSEAAAAALVTKITSDPAGGALVAKIAKAKKRAESARRQAAGM